MDLVLFEKKEPKRKYEGNMQLANRKWKIWRRVYSNKDFVSEISFVFRYIP